VDIAAWLQELGQERYLEAFRANDVDPDVLRTLTADDLKELGVASLGHRKKLLEAIAALQTYASLFVTLCCCFPFARVCRAVGRRPG
jgi:hypothetical protein